MRSVVNPKILSCSVRDQLQKAGERTIMIWNMRAAKSCRTAAAMALALTLLACSGGGNTVGTGTDSSIQTSAHLAAPTDPLSFSALNYSIAQGAGSVTLTVVRTGAPSAAVSIDYTTVDGTAFAGTDYTATTGSVQWAENDSTPKKIVVPISSATPYSGDKEFQVVLSNPGVGAQIGNPDRATVTISGDATAAAGRLHFSESIYAVAQSIGTMMVTVNRADGSSGAVSVAYATSNGTAVAGTDYTAASGVLHWADGDATSKTFTVAISNAAPFSGTKSFAIALSNPLSGATLGITSSATVTIKGDSSPPAGSLTFSTSSYTVAQNAGTVTVTVERTDGSTGYASVAYATSNGTAVSGTDFTAVNGTLNWASGDTTAKTFTIAISNATPFSGNKTLTVVLSNPSRWATIGNPGSASVTISGDATAPVGSLRLSAARYTVAQSAGTVTVTVVRNGGSNGAVSVAYATANGTAVAGTDYTAAKGTLKWADGDASANTFEVAISNATPYSGNKSFSVTLSSPSGLPSPSAGATLSTPSSASVSISGDAGAAVGSLQLSASSYTVGQRAGTLTVTVNRTGGTAGAVHVAYATSNGTAVAGTDFTSADGTLDWAAGDASSKTFSVEISNATPFSGSKSFGVTLSSPTGGATLSSPSSASVSITGSGGGATLLQQATVTGIAGNLFVNGARGAGGGDPPKGTFALVSDQANPLTSSGLFQVNTWDPSALTGFRASNPSGAQLAYAATGPTTIAQYEGNTLGVYLQSADLASGADQMIAAQTFYAGLNIFTSSSVVLNESMMLQVPTSSGATPFISVKHFFSGIGAMAGNNFDISVLLFHNGAGSPPPSVNYDNHGLAWVSEVALGDSRSAPYVTTVTGAFTGTPYMGFVPLSWSISQAQVIAAIKNINSTQGLSWSTDPTQYQITNIHVNAEIRGLPNSDTLGWSMKDWVVSLE